MLSTCSVDCTRLLHRSWMSLASLARAVGVGWRRGGLLLLLLLLLLLAVVGDVEPAELPAEHA